MQLVLELFCLKDFVLTVLVKKVFSENLLFDLCVFVQSSAME